MGIGLVVVSLVAWFFYVQGAPSNNTSNVIPPPAGTVYVPPEEDESKPVVYSGCNVGACNNYMYSQIIQGNEFDSRTVAECKSCQPIKYTIPPGSGPVIDRGAGGVTCGDKLRCYDIARI